MNAPSPRRVFLAPSLARSDLATRLRRSIRGQVLFDPFSRARYATDASIYQVEPIGIVVPRTEEDALAAIEIARELGTPILPRGGASSQCGQTVGAALVIDNSKHLNQVLDYDAEAGIVTVQPGIVLDRLNAWLKPHGVWFPVDVSTSAQATLGGMAGNNSCGSRSIEYGNMVHNVTGIDLVLSDGTQAYFGTFGDGGDMRLSNPRMNALVPALFSIAQREADAIRKFWPKVLRRVGGYNLDVFDPQSERPYTRDGSLNLAQLLVGSEGTLGYFRRLRLKVAPLPGARALGVINFPSFYRAMESAQHIVALAPVAVELVDRTMIELARANPAFRPVIEAALVGEPEAILLVEFAGADRQAQLARLRELVALMADLGLPGSVVEMPDERAQKALWEVRKAGLNIMMSMKGDGKPVSFIEDCAVPLEHLAEYTAQLTEVFARHGTRGTWYAHASVGTLHVRPILDMRRDGAVKMRAIAAEAAELVRRYKGAFSGEHGDGLVRSEWVEWQFGQRLTRAFEEVKDLFDPAGLMNPGKIVRPSRMDDARLFRFAPGYSARPLETALDWSAWNVDNDPATGTVTAPGTGSDPTGGFAKAVEMCNNNGHCRKFDAGTMCPSFRATGDEQHLTRGRANTLRMALSGQLGPQALSSEAMFATMDLCVGCKGCKRECPTGVDMTRMKTEFLYHYRRAHRLALGERLIAYLPRYAPIGSRLGALLALRERVPGLARLTERLLGFSARRSLPRFSGRPFHRSGEMRTQPQASTTDASRRDHVAGGAAAARDPETARDSGRREVLLLVDTFNNYFEPDNARAAHRVLTAAGFDVIVARAADGGRPLCCGRTFLAAGLVDQARAEARRLVDAVLPYARRGVPVVGLEPSCLLALRDEFLALKLGPDAETVAAQALLFEEFLAREHARGRLVLALGALGERRALLHGHCHQKAFDAMGPVEQVLRLVPELEVATIESSCCGMAGAFGYEAGHFEASMRMGEAALLPAVRAADQDTLIVADGTSCRHQIADGARREAIHVARVLERALQAAERTA